jgi:hypothetical protein
MKNIYITGDRSMEPYLAAGAVNAILKDLVRQNNGDLAIGTGNCNGGIERAVRYLIAEEFMNLAHYSTDEDGKPDFESTFRELEDVIDQVVFIHTDPLSSRIGRAVAAVFPEDKVSMPFQEVMAASL